MIPNEDLWINLYCDYFGIKEITLNQVTYLLRIHQENSYSNFPKEFAIRSARIHDRHAAYVLFSSQFKNDLDVEQLSNLDRIVALERLRSDGSLLSIIFIKKVSIGVKLQAIIYCNKFTYWFRRNFNSLFRFIS